MSEDVPARIRAIKSATVAIGLARPGETSPKVVVGTGFFVSSKGHLITAKHVFGLCGQLLKLYDEREEKFEIAAFRPVLHGDRLRLEAHQIEDRIGLFQVQKKSEGYIIADDIDVAIAGLVETYDDLPFLSVKPPTPISVGDRLAICGYPNGGQSLNLTTKFITIRLSPIMQFGHVGALYPVDDAPAPNVIQTDIMSTGGSSGSPILDANSWEVIGMAQQVITAPVFNTGTSRPTEYVAKVGLVYGITNRRLLKIATNIEAYSTFKLRTLQFDSTVFVDSKGKGALWG